MWANSAVPFSKHFSLGSNGSVKRGEKQKKTTKNPKKSRHGARGNQSDSWKRGMTSGMQNRTELKKKKRGLGGFLEGKGREQIGIFGNEEEPSWFPLIWGDEAKIPPKFHPRMGGKIRVGGSTSNIPKIPQNWTLWDLLDLLISS